MTVPAAGADIPDGRPRATPVYFIDMFGSPLVLANGGTQTTPVAAGVAADTVIKTGAGRLCKILITTLGTNALVIYDNATGHTGTIIGYVAANAIVGTVVDVQMPAAFGITCQGNSNNPAFTVSWS